MFRQGLNISSNVQTIAGLYNEEEQRNGANVQILRASFSYVQDPLEHIGNCHHIGLKTYFFMLIAKSNEHLGNEYL